jgi:hypothetical protein
MNVVPDRREPWIAAALGALLFLACCLVAPGGLLDNAPYGDVHLYAHYARRMFDGQWPYRDFFDEYPPLAQPLFLLAKALPGTFAPAFKWTMAVCGAGAVALLIATVASIGASRVRIWTAAVAGAVAPVCVGKIFLNAYDLWPALLFAGSLLALVRGRDELGFALLALAVAAKVYPAAALPVALIWAARRGTLRRDALWFVGVLVAVHLPFLATGPGGVRFSYWVQIKRGLQVESLGASALLAAQRAGAYTATLHDQAPGSKNVLGPAARDVALLSSVAAVAAVVAIAWLYWRGVGSLVLCSVAAVAAFLAFNKVFSPQYVDWLAPLAPAAGPVAAALALVAMGLTQVLFDHYSALYAVGWGVWLLLARNLVVLAIFAVLAGRILRTRTASTATSTTFRTSTAQSIAPR